MHFYMNHWESKIFRVSLVILMHGRVNTKLIAKGHFTLNRNMKISTDDFFGKCDQICNKLRIWSHLLKKSLMENFSFCAVCHSRFLVSWNCKNSMETKRDRNYAVMPSDQTYTLSRGTSIFSSMFSTTLLKHVKAAIIRVFTYNG